MNELEILNLTQDAKEDTPPPVDNADTTPDPVDNTHSVPEVDLSIDAQEIGETVQQNLTKSTEAMLNFGGLSLDLDQVMANIISFSIQLFLAVLVFWVGKWIGNRLIGVARRLMARSRLDPTVASFLSNLMYGVMIVVVGLAALNQVGINTSSFVAVLGGVAVGVGISLKDQLSNLAAGVLIVLFRPFNRGDYVEIKGNVGYITDITLVNTRIKTPNNHEVIVPNGDIMTNPTTNYSSLANRRLEINVGIGYEDDIDTARAVAINTALTQEGVLTTPAPLVRVVNLGDSSVDLRLYVWCENEDFWAVECNVREAVKKAFDKADINIPYPQQDIHISQFGKLMDALSKRTL